MNFTREPITETVITPREGCKLVVRSSKANGPEDFCVDAVEVVSFGHSFFFRCLEKPKAFLVPVSDYEIIELRETRMVLKNVPAERSQKATQGREGPPRPAPAPREEAAAETDETAAPAKEGADRSGKRDRRRRRGRGRERTNPDGTQVTTPDQAPAEEAETAEVVEANISSEETKPVLILSKLFVKPPTGLIRDYIAKMDEKLEEVVEKNDEDLQNQKASDEASFLKDESPAEGDFEE